MKKAIHAHDQTVQYYSLVRSNMRFILDNAPDDFRSDFYRANGRRTCYMVIAGDKGMCGGYNHDVLKLAYREIMEARHHNVRLITFGHMATDFFRRVGYSQRVVSDRLSMSPEAVVRASLRGLARGRAVVVPGWRNKLAATVTGCLPRVLVARATAKLLLRYLVRHLDAVAGGAEGGR